MLPLSTLLAAVACIVTFLPAVVTNGGLVGVLFPAFVLGVPHLVAKLALGPVGALTAALVRVLMLGVIRADSRQLVLVQAVLVRGLGG